MKNRIMAVCDPEIEYAYKLMEYLGKHKANPLEVYAFSSLETLQTFKREHSIELLLIHERLLHENQEEWDIPYVVVLSEQNSLPEEKEYPAVFKFQPAAAIMQYLLDTCSETELDWKERGNNHDEVTIIGVYAPAGGSGKTLFALTLGQLLAQSGTAIYLNMEAYSGFETLLHKEYRQDLIGFISLLRQSSSNFTQKLNAVTETIQGLDYIPPAIFPEDLKAVAAQEWKELFQKLEESGLYQTIILDIGDHMPMELLEYCRKIYMPIDEDIVSMAKLLQFRRQLELTERTALQEKIVNVQLPQVTTFVEPEQLQWEETGAYIRTLLKEG